jgi:hypothetical protein
MQGEWKAIFTQIAQIFVSMYLVISLFVGWIWRFIKGALSQDSAGEYSE